MPVTNRHFEDLAYLADQLEDSTSFEIDLGHFIELSNFMKAELSYQYYRDYEVQNKLNKIPDWDPFPPDEGFLEKLLPKSSRKMYGKYKHKQKVLDQVRHTGQVFYSIHLLIREELS